MLEGWKRYRDYPDLRVRQRFTREMKKVSTAYNAALWAMERQFRKVNKEVSDDIRSLRREIQSEFPLVGRVTAGVLGPVLLWSALREEKLLARGRTYEPPTIIERSNWAMAR
jgi:hypothetical protein